MTLAAGDIHTFAMTKPALQALFALIDGAAVVQVGMLTHKLDDGHWAASHVFTGGPAHVAGVVAGDELVSIDGAPIAHGYMDFAYLLGVAPNTEAHLVVKHAGVERTLVLHLTSIATPILESRVIGDVGYARILSCTHSTDPARDAAALLGKALGELERRKLNKLVIDLRGNAGGFPFDLASLLVEADPLMYGITGGEGTEQPVARTKLAPSKTKWAIAVIVDESTASGAEMLALALRDHAAAAIIGRPTAGGLTFPTTEKITSDVTISYPLSRVGGKTKAVQDGNRITPDLAAPNPTADDFAADRDPQLDAAIAILKK
jgi:carboxyl-terminal processing protease